MKQIADLPEIIPVFPLPGALLLPRSRLPLHIFEPRYLAMIDDAMKTPERLIGMIQPAEGRAGGLHLIGCAGRLTAFSETDDGRWYPEFFRINFSRCIFCGMCEEACPTTAIQLTPDFEMAEFNRQNLVYEKEHLLISGGGKNPDYNFYRVSGMAVAGKAKGEAQNESAPVNIKSLMP